MTNIETIAVVGAGIMGRGIAQAAAVSGFRTTLVDVNAEILAKATAEIRKNLEKGELLGKLVHGDTERALRQLNTTVEMKEAASAADLIIEAVPESMELKIRTFTALDNLAPESCLLATNTSALSITEMAAATRRPAQFIGMHFFNPVHLMRLVEIVSGKETSDQTRQAAHATAKRMGKETVDIRESPGFVTTRMNAMIGNEAFRMLQEGVATAEDIDKAIKLGLNHPMGPFELGDLVGLDTRLSILRYLHSTLGEKYRPSELLVEYVEAGRLGRKVGRGVYSYDEHGKKK